MKKKKKMSKAGRKMFLEKSFGKEGPLPSMKQRKSCNRKSKMRNCKRATKKYSKIGNIKGLKRTNRVKSMDKAETNEKSQGMSQESATPDAQSVLLDYLKQNPKNSKVLTFLRKHYDIEYDFDTEQWRKRDNPENTEKLDLPSESISTALSSLVNKDRKPSGIPQINSKNSANDLSSNRFGHISDSVSTKDPRSKLSRNRLFSDPRDYKSSKGFELEDYETFFQKQ